MQIKNRLDQGPLLLHSQNLINKCIVIDYKYSKKIDLVKINSCTEIRLTVVDHY